MAVQYIFVAIMLFAVASSRKVEKNCTLGDSLTNLTFTDLSNDGINFRAECFGLIAPTCMANCTWQRTCRRAPEWPKTRGKHTIVTGLRVDTNGRDYAQVRCCQSNTTVIDTKNCQYPTPVRNLPMYLNATQIMTDILVVQHHTGARIKVQICPILSAPLGKCDLKTKENNENNEQNNEENMEENEQQNNENNEQQQQENQNEQPQERERFRTPKNNSKDYGDPLSNIIGAAIGLPLGLGLGIGVPLYVLSQTTATTVAPPAEDPGDAGSGTGDGGTEDTDAATERRR